MTFKAEEENKKKEKSKFRFLKWIGFILLLSIVFVVFNFYKFNKEQEERRVVAQKQRQVLVEHWESQGLSKEEIEQNLLEERPERGDFEPSIFQRVMFTFRRATGNDPRDGSGRVMGGDRQGPGEVRGRMTAH